MNESNNTSTDTSEAIAASPCSGARLRKLFFETLYLSAFTFGGGYVIVSLLKKKFVDDLHWISEDEMLDLVAIAQSAPGPIAVNGAIVVGYKICGFPGILLSVLGAVIPPFLMLSVISLFYSAFRSNFMIHHLLSGMRCGVSAVIMSVTWDMASGVLIEKPKHPRPMQATEVEARLRKTGGTAFTLGNVQVSVHGDAFYPVGKLNELRRTALAMYEEEILRGSQRTYAAQSDR